MVIFGKCWYFFLGIPTLFYSSLWTQIIFLGKMSKIILYQPHKKLSIMIAINRTFQMSMLHRNEFGINWPKTKRNKRDKLPDNCENIDANDTNDWNTIPLQTKEYFRLQVNHDISNHTTKTIYDIFVFWCKKLSLLPLGLNGEKVYWGNNQDAKWSGSWFPIEVHCLVSTLCWCQPQNPS